VGSAKGWRRPVYAVLFGADIVFVGFAEILAVYALFRLHDESWERDVVFLALLGLTVAVVFASLKASAARREDS
jgi:predicted cobalt transporter CbtA